MDTASTGLPEGERWRAVRRHLNGNRHELTRLAAAHYPGIPRVESTPLLCRTGWVPDRPVDLSAITLRWRPDALPSAPAGGTPTRSYAAQLAAYDPPTLFEDRPCYRLIEVDDGEDGGGAGIAMTFCPAAYFDGVDVGEAVAHELAAAVAGTGGAEGRDGESGEARGDGRGGGAAVAGKLSDGGPGVTPPGLPLRTAVGDPTDLTRRPALVAVSVLTLRRDVRTGEATFVLHKRDAAHVAHGGGLSHVMPVGVFQPSAPGAAAARTGLDLWQCVVREYAEEFLGLPDDYGTDRAPEERAAWPLLRALGAARRASRVRVSYLGTGVDPLSFATDLLAVCVIDSDVFDEVFRDLVPANAEGTVLGAAGSGAHGLRFDAATVRRVAEREPMQAAGAAVLAAAWRHRNLLLAR